MEYAAGKRKRRTRGEMQVDGQDDEPEDPYTKMARKARNLKDILHVSLTLPPYAEDVLRDCQ
jgi:hypothetical protein